MGKHAEIIKFEKAVDKAAATWATETMKHIDKLEKDTMATAGAFRNEVSSIPVPKGAPDNEFASLGDRINEIIAQRGPSLKIKVEFKIKVDAKAKTLIDSNMILRSPILKS